MLAHLLLAALAGAPAVPAASSTTQGAAPSQSQARDEDLRWRVPLAEKAKIIQQRIFERNWINGTYASRAPVPADGRPVDRTITGAANLGHTASWTGSYLGGIAFQYGWAKEHGTPQDVETALNIGGGIVNGFYMLTHISGTPGFLSRGAAPGHGFSYEERGGSGDRDKWWQGVGQYKDYRFKGRPSHHNYDQTTRGLGLWYYFLSKYSPNPTGRVKAQMDSVRTMYQDIINYAYKSHDLTVYDLDGTISATLLFGQAGRPSTTSLMVTNALTYGYWITKDPWCRTKLQQVMQEYNYLAPGAAQNVKEDADDTEHTFPGLWLAYQVEQDPQIKRFYQECATSLFDMWKTDRRSFFNYMYAAITGDRAGADIPGALRTLQEYPTETILYPIMNSIRTDIEFQFYELKNRMGLKTIQPFYDITMDNEYDWKSGGRWESLDNWLARPVTSFAASGEDPMVWFLSDGQYLYQSLDGGRTFGLSGYPPNVAVRDITFAGNRNRIALLATDDGVYVTYQGGAMNLHERDVPPPITWRRQQVGPAGDVPQQVIVDRLNPNVVWAVMDDGEYRSADMGRNDIGKLWQRVSPGFPRDWRPSYTVATGRDAVIYALAQGKLYRAAPGDVAWTPLELGRLSSSVGIRQIAVVPDKPDTLVFLFSIARRGQATSFVATSVDGGRTLQGMPQDSRSLRALMQNSPLAQADVTSIVIDPNNPRNVYAASSKGVYRSTDGGVIWAASNNGLRIPYVYQVYAPKELGGKIVCSTPAGLHVSTDGGRTWSREILVLNGFGLDRVDRGGMGYLVAYWPGRYFGYITDEEAAAAPRAWGW